MSLGDFIAHLKGSMTTNENNRLNTETAETDSSSSTDDYVRELLDPDARPRNVWRLVEGPKVQPEAEIESQKDDATGGNSPGIRVEIHEVRGEKNEFNLNQESDNNIRDNDDDHVPVAEEDLVKSDAKNSDDKNNNSDDDRAERSNGGGSRSDDRHRSRPHSSHRRTSPSTKNDRHSGSRDSDRIRSGGKDRNRDDTRDDHDRKQSRRRRNHSDVDDDADYHKSRHSHDERRRSRTSSRHHKRSRSRSRSRSQSPVTKRDSRTILIMQLNPRVDSRDLEDFFSDIGKVREVRLIMDSKTRRHKGIAYIEFEEATSAAKAFSLNGQKFFGAPIVIQSAQMDRSRVTSGNWHSSTSQIINHPTSHPSSRSLLPPNCYRVYVGGLHVNLTEEMIRSVFQPFGPIVRLELMKDRVTSVSRGYAFITYANIEDGQNAVQALDGFELAGKCLRVSKSTDKSERHMTPDSYTAISGNL